MPEAEYDPHDGHPLEDAVYGGESLGELLHRLGLVKVGPERDQDILVGGNDLAELLDLRVKNSLGTERVQV